MLLAVAARPHVAFLWPRRKRRFSDLQRTPENEELSGVVIFRAEASLLYFNADHVRQVVSERLENCRRLGWSFAVLPGADHRCRRRAHARRHAPIWQNAPSRCACPGSRPRTTCSAPRDWSIGRGIRPAYDRGSSAGQLRSSRALAAHQAKRHWQPGKVDEHPLARRRFQQPQSHACGLVDSAGNKRELASATGMTIPGRCTDYRRRGDSSRSATITAAGHHRNRTSRLDWVGYDLVAAMASGTPGTLFGSCPCSRC